MGCCLLVAGVVISWLVRAAPGLHSRAWRTLSALLVTPYHSLLHQGFCPAYALLSCCMLTSGKWGTVERKALQTCGPLTALVLRRDGRVHRRRQPAAWGPHGLLHLPKPDSNILSWLVKCGLWSCPALVSVWCNLARWTGPVSGYVLIPSAGGGRISRWS